MKILVAIAVVALFYASFYRRVVKHWERAGKLLVDRLGITSTSSAREAEAVGKLACASVAQAAFAVLLLAAFRLDPRAISGFQPILIILGVVLGFGEMSLSRFFCTAMVHLNGFGNSRLAVAEWLAASRSGWMGLFAGTIGSAPSWFSATIIAVYVAGEEIVFRAILISVLAPNGPVFAVGISTLLFVAAQAFNMPTLRAAAFPMVGALVVGIIHGALYWRTRDVVPLIGAHLAYFATALSTVGKPLARRYR